MKYLYIHGANATSQSFNYIRDRLSGTDIIVDYQSSRGFTANLEAMYNEIEDQKDLFIVAHSLGGIYALNLANRLPGNIIGAVTISTPYGGCSSAEIAKWMMPHTQLFRDVAPTSSIIRNTMSLPLQHQWTQIVSTRGRSPWMLEDNDGVVTCQSMRARPDMELIDLELNHYEVMQSPSTIKIILDKVKLSSQ